MTLPQRLVEWLNAEGPVPFDAYMTSVLYEPGFGYYQTRVPGDDYRTSPVISRWFGHLIARWLEARWEELGSVSPFRVIEIGPGRGDLAADALSAAGGSFGDAIEWILVEPFEAIASRQRGVVLDPRARWVHTLEEVEPGIGCIVANEVLDNFPVKQFEVTEDGTAEIHVTIADGRLAEVLVPSSMSTPSCLQPGDRFETSPHIVEWVGRAARLLDAGSMLLIDYGDIEPDIWCRRPTGTVTTYGPDGLGTDPLADPGGLDITAHVNFSSVIRDLSDLGFATSLASQRSFLKQLGIDAIADTLRAEQAAAGRDPRGLTVLSERSRLTTLTAEGGLGDLKVLTAHR